MMSHEVRGAFLIFALLNLLLLSISTVTATTCQPFSHFLKGQFQHFIMYQRRGVSDNIVNYHYCNVVDALLHVVEQNYPKVVRLNAAWICQTDVNDLNSRINLNSIDAYINSVLLEDQHSFYLRSSHYTVSQLNLTLVQQRLVNNIWKIVETEMARRPSNVQTSTLCSLPKAIRLFFDPMALRLREEFSRKFAAGGSIVLAEELLYQTAASAARLKLINPNDDTHNLMLRHCIAYIFLAMRTMRLDGGELFVQNSYVAAYNALFKEATKQLNVSTVPSFPPDIVREHLGGMLQPLVEFDMGTKLALIANDERGNKLLRSVTNKILTPGRLSLMEKASNRMLTKHNSLKSDRADVSFASVYDEIIPTTIKQSDCPDGFSTHPSSVNIECCADMCLVASETLLTDFSVEECCDNCNEISCDLDNDMVREAVNIQVPPLDESSPVIEVTL